MSEENVEDPERSIGTVGIIPPSCLVCVDWQAQKEAKVYLNSLLKRKKRTHFGLLERPGFDSVSLGRYHTACPCKMFMYGRAGVGKTSLMLKLSGVPIPAHHQDTLGIQTTTIYWPAKLQNSEKVAVLQMELWDVGGKALLKYNHLLPSCLSAVDIIAFLFSYTDRSSWDELPASMQRVAQSAATENYATVVIGTRVDSPQHEVTVREVEEYQKSTGIRVISVSCLSHPPPTDGTLDGFAQLLDAMKILNSLTEVALFHRSKKEEARSAGGTKVSSHVDQ